MKKEMELTEDTLPLQTLFLRFREYLTDFLSGQPGFSDWSTFQFESRPNNTLEAVYRTFGDVLSQKQPEVGLFELDKDRDGLFAPETIYFECSVVVTHKYEGCACTSRSRTSGLNDWARNRWISDSLHISREKHLFQGRGNWLFESDIFRDWLELNGRSFLWLQGSAGTGKSMLTSAVINALKSSTDGLGRIVAFFCYDGRFKCSNIALEILWSMLQELLTTRNADQESLDFLQNLSTALEITGDNLSITQMKFFFSAMRHNLKSHETLFLVLDGLDDIENLQSGADDLLPELLTMATLQDPQHRIKCFISSRPDYSQRVGLPGSRVDIDREPSAQNDLATYVRQEVSRLWLPNSHHDIQALIEKLISKSKGIFLWVSLVVRALSTETSAISAIHLLETSIKPDLCGIYDYILSCLTFQDRTVLIPMLKLVSHAARPLSQRELNWICHVATDTMTSSVSHFESNLADESVSHTDTNIKTGSSFHLVATTNETDMARVSGGLLTLGSGHSVSLIHLSARGYFRSLPQSFSSWASNTQDFNEVIALACLKAMPAETMLQSLNLPTPEHIETKQSKLNIPIILPYAIRYWKFHYGVAESRSKILPGSLHTAVKAAFQADHHSYREPSGHRTIPYHNNKAFISRKSLFSHSLVANAALIAAARFGFESLAKLELQMGATSHVIRGPFEYTALHLAARENHLGIAKLLFQYDAIPSVKTKNGQTPLVFAAAGGHSEMIELLLEQGANTQAVRSTSPASSLLHDSIQAGFQELELEATVSESCSNCGEMRAYYVVRLLLHSSQYTSH
jgi:hypothetical protein